MENFTKDYDFPSGLILPIDKPYRWTSADVVRKIRVALRHLGYKKIKVGHAGTLDPLATGILIICIGKSTKEAEYMQSLPKSYIAEIELGATTPCFDLEHEVDFRFPYEHITKEMVEEALESFKGEIEQVPPIFSAKRVDGKRAYKLARNGEEVELKPSLVEIYDISLLEYDLPKVKIKVNCSKGTYIRSIARDLGLKLNSGGHLTGLRRIVNGKFIESDMLNLDDVVAKLSVENPQ